jgi:hypothetical protein
MTIALMTTLLAEAFTTRILAVAIRFLAGIGDTGVFFTNLARLALADRNAVSFSTKLAIRTRYDCTGIGFTTTVDAALTRLATVGVTIRG